MALGPSLRAPPQKVPLLFCQERRRCQVLAQFGVEPRDETDEPPLPDLWSVSWGLKCTILMIRPYGTGQKGILFFKETHCGLGTAKSQEVSMHAVDGHLEELVDN